MLTPCLSVACFIAFSNFAAAHGNDAPAFGPRDQNSKLRGPVVSVSFDKEPIRSALLSLCVGRANFVSSPDIQGVVTGDYRDLPLEQVLHSMLGQVDSTYRVESDIFEIIERERFPGSHFGDRRIALCMNGVPLEKALSALCSTAGGRFTIAKGVSRRVNVSGSFECSSEAAAALVGQTNGLLCLRSGEFHVVDGGIPPLDVRPAWETVNVKLREEHADVRDALRDLFRNINVNYSIAPEVQGTVSCDVSGDFPKVLMRLLGSVRAFYHVESGVIQIVPEPGRPPTPLSTSRAQHVRIPDRFHKLITPKGLTFKDTSVDVILATFFTQIPNRYVLKHKDIRRLTVDLGNEPLDTALERLLDQTSLAVTFVDGVFVFDLPPKPYVPPGIRLGGGPVPDFLIFGQNRSEGWLESEPAKNP